MWKRLIISGSSHNPSIIYRGNTITWRRTLTSINNGNNNDIQNGHNNTTVRKPTINPLKDFNLHSPFNNSNSNSLKLTLSDLGSEVDQGLNKDDNSLESKEKLRKALMLENSEIRETALATKFGPIAGRTVDVINGDTASAFRKLDYILSSNSVWKDSKNQRFHMKPGKRKEMKRSQHHRKRFMKGFKRLMDVVKDAKRKGY